MATTSLGAADTPPMPVLGEDTGTAAPPTPEPMLIRTLQAFENASTNIAAAQMRNALTNLSDSVKDPAQKKVSVLRRPLPSRPAVADKAG